MVNSSAALMAGLACAQVSLIPQYIMPDFATRMLACICHWGRSPEQHSADTHICLQARPETSSDVDQRETKLGAACSAHLQNWLLSALSVCANSTRRASKLSFFCM